jgi:hypothetical protein
MKTLPFLFLALSLNSYAQTVASVVKFIPNFAKVDKAGNVYRGKEPKKVGAIDALAKFGITDVVIFKNDMKGEVVKEIAELDLHQIASYEIPFKWKDIDFNESCLQVVDALNTIQTATAAGGKVMFHCTAGEDRTGLLAGTYRMLTEKISTQVAFEKEMCANGYSDGNPGKFGMVTGPIQKGLTPLFLEFAGRIQAGKIKLGKINKSICKDFALVPTTLTCKTSKTFFKN